jgi:hypothetical protein
LQATIKVIGLLKIDGGEGFKREKTTWLINENGYISWIENMDSKDSEKKNIYFHKAHLAYLIQFQLSQILQGNLNDHLVFQYQLCVMIDNDQIFL